MAPSTWLNRLCSAPGKTRKAKPSWWMKRSRCTGRLLISAASSGSARMNPWTGSRSESAMFDEDDDGEVVGKGSRKRGRSVQVRAAGEVAVRAQQVDHLLPAAQDRQDGQAALRQRLDEELELAQGRQVDL